MQQNAKASRSDAMNFFATRVSNRGTASPGGEIKTPGYLHAAAHLRSEMKRPLHFCGSRDEFLDDAAVYVSKAKIAASVAVGERFVIKAH